MARPRTTNGQTDLFDFFVRKLCSVPWESMGSGPTSPKAPPAVKAPATSLAPTVPAVAAPTAPAPASPIAKPGCTAADETLVVKGHLEGIVDGLWSTSVLQHDIPRLDRAIQGARQMGAPDVVERLETIKAELPNVRDPEAAKPVLASTIALVPAVGELAKRCGKAGSPETWAKAKELSTKVVAGEMTKEQAMAELQRS